MKFPFPTSPEEAGGGVLVGFLSTAAGSGATTLACLTALALAESGHEVSLVDFQPQGKVRSYMGLTLDVCPASVLDASEVNRTEEIGKVGVMHPRGVFVLPGAARLLDIPLVDSRVVMKILLCLKKSFPFTIAVLGPLSGSGWAGALLANTICLVAGADRPSLDFYKEEMDILGRLGCSQRTKVIFNQSNLPGGMRDADVKELLKPDAVIPYDVNIKAAGNKRFLAPGKLKRILLDLAKDGAA